MAPPHRLPDYAVDGLTPQAVVQPDTREAISEVLRWAASEGLAVMPRGGGTQLSLGNLPRRVDLVLDLSKLNRLLDYQPADLTATVEAGITLDALQRELAPGGKLAPLEAPLPHRATAGGILATSASGPLRHTYGPARDWLIGVSVVGPDGVETRAGGKVVKNVTGYDLNKLYTGSLGTLGIIVEATFKLAPVSAEGGAVVAVFPSLQPGLAASRDLLARVFAPQGVQVVNAPVARRLSLPVAAVQDEVVVLAHFSGRPRAVRRCIDESARLLQSGGSAGLERLDQEAAAGLLRRLTDLGWSRDTAPHLGLRLNVPPNQLAGAVTWPDVAGREAPPGIVADPGFGGVRLLWWRDSDIPTLDDPAALAIIHRVQERAATGGGSAIVEHCPLSIKPHIDVWGKAPDPALLELMRRIKHNLDPSGTLNPGRFVGRL